MDFNTIEEIQSFVDSVLASHRSSPVPVSFCNDSDFIGYTGFYTDLLGVTGISFSRVYWPRMTPDQRKDTILHEVAHVLSVCFDRSPGHGRAWKTWCRRIGCVPRAKQRKVSRVFKQKTYLWECPVPSCDAIYAIGGKGHFRQLRNPGWHKKCNARVRFTGYILPAGRPIPESKSAMLSRIPASERERADIRKSTEPSIGAPSHFPPPREGDPPAITGGFTFHESRGE